MDRSDDHRRSVACRCMCRLASRRSAVARRVVVVRAVRSSRRRARGCDHRRLAVVDGYRDHDVTVPGNWTMQDTGDSSRTTPTCRCRFAGRRRRLPERDTTGRVPHDVRGAACVEGHARSCCTSAAPRACTRCTSTASSWATAPTAGCRASTTCRSMSSPARPTTSRSSSSATAPAATSRIRISGGWPVCTARSTSSPGRSSTSPTCVATATTTPPPATAASKVATEVAFGTKPGAGMDGAHHLAQSEGSRRRQAVRQSTGAARVRRAATSSPATRSRRSGQCRRARRGRPRHPNLYEVTCELLNPDGRCSSRRRHIASVCAVSRCATGKLLVNGQPIWIFGVNRHDHHPDRGKAVNADDIRADLQAMRAHNITAVRTCHYPNDQRAVRPVRRVGDVRHRRGQHREPRLQHQHLRRPAIPGGISRARRAHGAARPQPSVDHPVEPRQRERLRLESRRASPAGSVASIPAARCTTRVRSCTATATHPPRSMANWVSGGLQASDITCPMYPQIETIRQYGADGVGPTSADHVRVQPCDGQLQRLARRLLGDDHVDAGSAGRVHLGVEGPRPAPRARPTAACDSRTAATSATRRNDGNFVADGLMSADLEPHPAMREVAWVYRPVTVSLHGGRRTRSLRDHQPPIVRRSRRSRRLVGAARWPARSSSTAGCAVPQVDPRHIGRRAVAVHACRAATTKFI